MSNPVEITSFSMMANLHRNLNRPYVDELFKKRDKLIEHYYHLVPDTSQAQNMRDKINHLDTLARKLWRDIIEQANKL